MLEWLNSSVLCVNRRNPYYSIRNDAKRMTSLFSLVLTWSHFNLMHIYGAFPICKTPSGHFTDPVISDRPQFLSSLFYNWEETCTNCKYNEKGDTIEDHEIPNVNRKERGCTNGKVKVNIWLTNKWSTHARFCERVTKDGNQETG